MKIQNIKKVLIYNEIDGNSNSEIETDIIIDTIPTEYQYFLEIDDHFN